MTLPRNAWMALGLIVLLGLGGFLATWRPIRSVRDLAEEKRALQARIARSDDGAAAVRRLEDELAKTAADAVSRLKPIPADSDVASLIRELTERLDALGIHDREITTGAPQWLDDVSSMPMSVKIQGDFRSVYACVKWVESLPRLVRVQRLKIDTEKTKGSPLLPGEVSTDLLLDLFYAPRDASSAAGAPPKRVAGAGAGGQP